MTDPKPFQIEGVVAIDKFGGRALLADEQGLGKTFQSLYWIFWRKKRRPVVIVCPAAVKYNWQHEAMMHFNLRSDVIEGRKIPKRALTQLQSIIILNYEILGAWVPFLKKLGVQVVILDEVQSIKNRESQRSTAVKKLCADVPHVIACSGTPLTNRPSELWPVLNILAPERFDSFVKFAFEFCKPKRLPWGWEYSGARNLDVLHRELKELCMIRRLKKDVLQELPPKERHTVAVRLARMDEYEFASNDFLEWLKTVNPVKLKKAQRAEAVTRVSYLRQLTRKLKKRHIFEWIDSYLENTDEKLVVFTMHRKMIECLQLRYPDESVTVDGTITGKRRHAAVQSFQKDKRVRLFFGNIRAAGVGITLTRATTCLFCDLPWTPGDLVQGEDRIHRIGQEAKAQIYYLIAKDTIEEYLCKLLQSKQAVLDEVLDGGVGADDFDVFDELIKVISRKKLIKK